MFCSSCTYGPARCTCKSSAQHLCLVYGLVFSLICNSIVCFDYRVGKDLVQYLYLLLEMVDIQMIVVLSMD